MTFNVSRFAKAAPALLSSHMITNSCDTRVRVYCGVVTAVSCQILRARVRRQEKREQGKEGRLIGTGRVTRNIQHNIRRQSNSVTETVPRM